MQQDQMQSPRPKRKYAVVGSRGFNDAQRLKEELDRLDDFGTLVSGGAKGADTLAEEYVEYRKIEKVIIKPDYKSFGKAAPIKRNSEIVEMADFVIIFWDGESRGTADVIRKCERDRKPYKIIRF